MLGIVGWKRTKSRLRRKKNCAYSLLNCRVWRCLQVGHAYGRAAAEKRCARTSNSLSDSGVRRAIEGIALRGWRRHGHGHGYASHTMPYCLQQACFFFGGADFFFAKRLFFRYGEGCEGRASRATVGVTAKDNGGACFPLVFGITPTIGRQPSHPHRSGFFCSFHATCAPTWGFVPQPTLSDGRFAPRSDLINSINS